MLFHAPFDATVARQNGAAKPRDVSLHEVNTAFAAAL
jgi:hypothetical protein